MPKFIINYNGEFEVITAESRAVAEDTAYERWLEAADQDYGCEEWSAQKAKEYGLEEDSDASTD